MSNEYELNRHSKKTYLSFGMTRFTMTFVFAPIDLFLLFYYVQVIGLNVGFYAIALLIFSVWDAVDDPIIAWLIDRNFKWTAKWGRRFPWIVIGSLPWAIGLFLLFSVPPLPPASVDPFPTFLWLIVALFIFDLFGAIAMINIQLLFPDKFRTEEERRLLMGYNTPISMIAIAIGMLIPPLLLRGQDVANYRTMGLIVTLITLISVVLYLPGCREDQQVKELYLADNSPRISLLKGYWSVIKMKSFWMQFLATVMYMTVNGILMGLLVYIFTFEFNNPGLMIMALAVWLLAAICSVPVWIKLAKKYQNTKKIYTLGMVIYGVAFGIFFFYFDLISLLIFAAILGFTVGNMWTFNNLIYAHVLDEHMVRTGKNQKGMVQGVNAIFNRLAATIDTYLIAFVFGITGFAAYAGVTTLEELQAVATTEQIQRFIFGFHLLIGIIPMILLLVGALIFWFIYPLDKETVFKLKEKIKELKL
ncbi:MAG: MFS transporter [Promethearchaeota archaeon]